MTASRPASTPPWTAIMHAADPRRLLPTSARPPADSLAFYAVLVAVGVAELVEWPAVLIAAAAQALVDRRLAELAQLTAGHPVLRPAEDQPRLRPSS